MLAQAVCSSAQPVIVNDGRYLWNRAVAPFAPCKLIDRARQIDEDLRPAYDLLAITTNPIPIKAALNLLGHDVGAFRLPLVPPTGDELDQVRSCLSRLGLLVAA